MFRQLPSNSTIYCLKSTYISKDWLSSTLSITSKIKWNTTIHIDEFYGYYDSLESWKNFQVLLNRTKNSVDIQLRDRQIGSVVHRPSRDTTDHSYTINWMELVIIHVNSLDYEKTFDSLGKRTLWNFLRHYGVPDKIVNIIRNS